MFSAGGCGLNEMQGAYGPPPEKTEQTALTERFVPSRNEIRCVYGPPAYFQKLREEREKSQYETEKEEQHEDI